jgi:hypothetical protein
MKFPPLLYASAYAWSSQHKRTDERIEFMSDSIYALSLYHYVL